jgi:hypothetical protein
MSETTTIPPALIPPALTPEEWARHGFNHGALSAERFRDLFMGKPTGNLGAQIKPDLWVTDTPRDCHALAALCLYGQTFGFPHEAVAALRDAAELLRSRLEHFTGYADEGSRLRNRAMWCDAVADRLVALLPPPPA